MSDSKNTKNDPRLVRMPDAVFNALGTAVALENRGEFINNRFASGSEGMIAGKMFEEKAGDYASLIASYYNDHFWHFVDINSSDTLYIYPQNDILYELSHDYVVDNKTFGVLCTIASLDRCSVAPNTEKLTTNAFHFQRERLELAIFALTSHLLSVEKDEQLRADIVKFQETINYYAS